MTGKKHLYIIRHGETDFNKLGVVQGSGVDSPLNEVGLEQARRFYKHYHQAGFDKIYMSALQRTHQSVAPFIEGGIPAEIVPELNEISWGIYEGQMVSDLWKADYWAMIRSWENGTYDVSVPEGESPVALQIRQRVALEKIMGNIAEQKVLICMHGRAMKSFLCLLLERELNRMEDFQHTNLCLYQLVYEDGKFNLMLENDTTHLL